MNFALTAWAPAIYVAALALNSTSRATDRLVEDVKQFEAALEHVQPGDAIVLRDGVWESPDLLFDAQGTAEQPITLRAQSPGGVTFQGATELRIGGRHLVVSGIRFHNAYNDDHLIAFRRDSKQRAEDCRLTGCELIDCNHPTDAGESRWITLYGKRNRVDHCSITGKTAKGTTLVAFIGEEPNHHRIDHNYFGPREKLGKNGGETIRIGDSDTSQFSSQTIVENNCFDRCNGEAEIISNKSCDNIYRYNTFLRCSGALTLRHGHRALVEGNYFLGQRAGGTGGVRIIGSGHRVINNYFSDLEGDDARAALSIMNGMANTPADGYEPVADAVVAFNSFVNNKETLVVGLTDEDDVAVPPTTCAIANNLIVPRRDRKAIRIQTEPIGFTWTGNIVQGDVGAAIEGVRQSPDLQLRQDGLLWRLAQNSPALDAASPGFDDITRDIAARHRGPQKDVGCEERSSRTSSGEPLAPSDVGPSWATKGR
jgi:poly(beta-D-mannuronate) lyase